MKYFLLVLLGTALFSCSTPSNESADNSSAMITADDEAILRDFKTVQWPKAYGEQDTVLLERLLHDKFQMIDDNGDVYTKADELEYIANYGPSYDEFNFEIIRLDMFDNGTAIISGVGTMKGVEAGEAYITKYKSSNVLVKVDGQWKAISSHVSGVKEEKFPMAPTE